jgi:hypothetical protein
MEDEMDHISIQFNAESNDEITEKVAAVMKGVTKTGTSSVVESIEKKGGMKYAVSALQEMAKYEFTIEESEFLLDAMKSAIKQNTIFALPPKKT